MSPHPLWLVKTVKYFNMFAEVLVAGICIAALIACMFATRPDVALLIAGVFMFGLAFETAIDPSYQKEMAKEMRLATT